MTALPEWLPTEAWEGFVEMRKNIKKPLKTAYAVKLAIGNLEKMRAEGHDVAAVLDQSTMNSWLGLFPVQERRADTSTMRRTAFPSLGKHGQATANNLQDWLEDFQ